MAAQASEVPPGHHRGAHRVITRELPYSTNRDGSAAKGEVRVSFDVLALNKPVHVDSVEYKFDKFVPGKSPLRALVYWWDANNLDFGSGQFKYGTQTPVRDGDWHVLSAPGGYDTSSSHDRLLGAAEMRALNGDDSIRMFSS
jgi:hypothetical protein